jgi:hypothetical protein
MLTAPLAATAVNATGPTIDLTDTLAVDLTESEAALSSGSTDDALALATACYVGGEIVAYRDATLTAAFKYDLTYLNRGVYGTDAAQLTTHPVGTPFARLDAGVFRVPFDKSRIGSTIYIKFQSFNVWGGGLQDVSTLAPYTYVITGSALSSPLPDVTNLYANYEAGFEKVYWDEIDDFRNGIMYEIRQGSVWDSALFMRTQAHPPFIAQGNGTFLIKAVCQPVPGLTVYSETAAQIVIAGNQLSLNLLAGFDERATNWGGTFDNGIGIDVAANTIRLGGAGDILAATDILAEADVIDYGGIIVNTPVYYTIPAAHVIHGGSVVQASVNGTLSVVGVPVGADILGIPDILAVPDILASSSTQWVDGWIEINLSQDNGATWGGWQKFVPGTYAASDWNFRFALQSVDPNTVPYGIEFSYAVQLPARIDHYQGLAVPDTGFAITFARDGVVGAAPFNGGPGGAALPYWNVSWQAQAGDTYQVTGLALGGMTVKFLNGGVGVARSGVNINVEGF